MTQFQYFFAALVLSFLFTWAVRWYALRFNVSDVPNERSLHQGVIPRGGGVSLVLVLTAVTQALGGGSWIYLALFVALLGFVDDHRSISAQSRLSLQAIAAVGAVLLIDGFPSHFLGWMGAVFWVLFLIWLTNLYNFMDGIDGIAGVQLLSFGAGLWALGYHFIGLSAVGAACGFLFWNWTPARIFMGDVGSVFLGFWMGCVILELSASGMNEPHPWAIRMIVSILLWFFIGDATTTLVRRAMRGEKLFQAHRLHFYQNLAQRLGHSKISLSVLGLNLLLAVPLVVALDALMETQPHQAVAWAGGFWFFALAFFWWMGSGRVRN